MDLLPAKAKSCRCKSTKCFVGGWKPAEKMLTIRGGARNIADLERILLRELQFVYGFATAFLRARRTEKNITTAHALQEGDKLLFTTSLDMSGPLLQRL